MVIVFCVGVYCLDLCTLRCFMFCGVVCGGFVKRWLCVTVVICLWVADLLSLLL